MLDAADAGGAGAYRPISYHFQGDGSTKHRRMSIIVEAMAIVSHRIFDLRILRNTYQEEDRYFQAADLWKITNLNSYYSGKGYRDAGISFWHWRVQKREPTYISIFSTNRIFAPWRGRTQTSLK